MSAGKGMSPNKGRNLTKFRSGWDGINWGKKPLPHRVTVRVQTRQGNRQPTPGKHAPGSAI
jgi:hypothetical protein